MKRTLRNVVLGASALSALNLGAVGALERKDGTGADPHGGDIKKIIAEMGRAFEEFKTRNDKQLDEIKAGIKAAPADLDKLNKTLDTLTEAKGKLEAALEAQQKANAKAIEELELRLSRPGANHDGSQSIDFEKEAKNTSIHMASLARALNLKAPDELTVDGYKAYKSAMSKLMRRGINSLTADEQKTLIAGSDPDGGYMITADTSGRIITRVFETSPIRQLATVISISTDAIEGVIDRDEAGGLVMVGEQTAPATTNTPQIGKYRIPVHEGYVEPKATQQMLEDAAVDVEGWLARKVADKIARGQNTLFITGSGVGRPMGLFSYTTAATADDTRAWGQFEHVKTGVNGDFAATNPADHIFTLIGSFKDHYLARAKFFTRREVVTKMRLFKETTGQYLWQPGLQAGQPESFLGYPIVKGQDIPALSTNGLSLAFGDFAEAYTIVDRLGMTTLRDNLTAKPFVKFYTRVRFGGSAMDFEAVKFLKFST